MPTSDNLENLKAELIAARDTILPQIEGLEDFRSLDLKAATLTKVEQTLEDFANRRNLIADTLRAIEGLENDDFPNMPDVSVDQTVYADLKENRDTIEAAFNKFTSEMAATLGVSVGTPETKP